MWTVKYSGHSYESLSIPRANSGQDYVSQVWMTIFGHPANLMRQTFPLSPASPGHWVLEYSGGGEAEEYKTGAFHLSPTVSQLSPSWKLCSALKQVFTPSKKQDVWIFRRRSIHEEVGWQRKGDPKRFAAPYSGFSWCLFIWNYNYL